MLLARGRLVKPAHMSRLSRLIITQLDMPVDSHEPSLENNCTHNQFYKIHQIPPQLPPNHPNPLYMRGTRDFIVHRGLMTIHKHS